MSDLVERLRRRIIVDGCEMPGNDALHREAAEELERLRAALERIEGYDVLDPTGYHGVDAYAMADIAREALGRV